MVIFVSWEVLITWIHFCGLDSTNIRGIVTGVVHDFTELIPLITFPHICFRFSLISEHLNVALTCATNFTFYLGLEIW